MEKKKLLIIAATHGNEKIGIEALKELTKKGLNKYFDYLIANPKALQKSREFIDVNLNRSYPGKKNSLLYEERTAYENLKVARKYKYIIDIHEASEGIDDFVIIPRKRLSRLFPIKLIGLKKVLLWPNPKGPLAQVLDNAVELEFGAKGRNRKAMTKKAAKIIKDFIQNINLSNTKPALKQTIYYVYGKLTKKELKGTIKSLRDFRKVENNKEEFYPLLTNQYLKYGIVCYKMKKR